MTHNNKSAPTADSLCNTAAQQIAQQQFPQALNTYQDCTKQFPKHVAAYAGIARLLYMHGNHNHALQALSYALRIEPNNSLLRRQITPLLEPLTPTVFSAELAHDILLCLSENELDHQQLAHVTGALLWTKYAAQSTAPIAAALLRTLANDSLLLRYLSHCINTHPALEQWLTQVRKHLLISATQATETFPELACAIALTCFANEYLFAVTDAEQLQLTQLQLALATPDNLLIPNPSCNGALDYSLLLASMYRPLISILKQAPVVDSMQEPLIALLVTRTLYDLQQEQQLKNTFPTLARAQLNPDTVSVSTQVQKQYEENPYPRWQIPPTPAPFSIAELLHQCPTANHAALPSGNLSVLIAGCGTGYEPIDLARSDKNLHITALDLSRSSLAYGKRMANSLALNNIDFVQGNILDAENLACQFDLINSTGVLHHMEQPEAGWKILCELLKPGGVMRISLYSELARRRVVLAHQRIEELQLGNGSADIKRFRQDVLQQPANSALAELTQSDDFYSISGCRDLVFHVQEHRFTLPQLTALINQLNLRLIKFEAPAWAQHKFHQRYADVADQLDLDKWHEFELAHPDTFVGMYQFWLQKN